MKCPNCQKDTLTMKGDIYVCETCQPMAKDSEGNFRPATDDEITQAIPPEPEPIPEPEKTPEPEPIKEPVIVEPQPQPQPQPEPIKDNDTVEIEIEFT